MADLISELKQQDIHPAMLADKGRLLEAESASGAEIARYYQNLQRLSWTSSGRGRYIDMEDYLNLLIEKLEISQWLKGARVWVDSFTTFSSQSLRVIEQIMLQAEEVTVSLTMDPDVQGRDRELFDLSHYTF